MKAATRREVAVPVSLPAPVGGWNARDNIAAMPPTDAVILTNFIPTPTACVQRMGFTKWATGFSTEVNTVMALDTVTTTKLLAACGANIYDISVAGAIGAAVQAGLTSDKWQHVTFTNSSGNYLYMVNGLDAPRYWDGTTWTNAALTGPANINFLINVNSHMNRMWFVEKNTMTAWYGATSAIAGALTAFYLTGVSRLGGYLMAIATWTIDAGEGMDDMIVFITSNGEAIIYKGTNPAVAADWSLVGVFEIGTPIGRRCYEKYKGDLLVICQEGVTPLAQGLQSSRLDPRVNLTDKIQYATATAINAYGGSFGWQITTLPSQNLVILNVPVGLGSQQQFVMNTINGAWCNFTGWPANCWELSGNYAFFGANGYVGKAFDGLVDYTSNINGEGLQSFNYFGQTGRLKRFTMMRPILRTSGNPAAICTINVDYDTTTGGTPLTFVGNSAASWDSALWDVGLWGSDVAVSALWQGVNAIGYCGAPHLKTAAQNIAVQWVATDIVMERGDVL